MLNKINLIFILLGFFCFSQEKPNIIFILTDDQSPFPVLEDKSALSRPFGFNGDAKVHTPVIDSLARNGIIFTRAYVSSSVCAPSRYSILTGKYAGRSRGKEFMVLNPIGRMSRVENTVEFEEGEMTIAKYLKIAGYKTGFVGKSHVIDHHNVGEALRSHEGTDLKGYSKKADPKDEKVIKATQHNHQYWVQRVKDFGFDYAGAVYGGNLRELFNDSLNVHNVEWKNKAALDFIDQTGEEPFFLYYAETVPHGPGPWKKRKGKYVHGLDANPKFTGAGYLDVEFENMPKRSAILEEVTSQSNKDPDQAWLTWLDHSVGTIVKKLKEQGKLDNTLIVITSDHGDRRNGKATNYEDGIRVPLMMFWPKGIAKGQLYDELVQNVDFAPTFLDIAGVDISKENFDGVSLKGVLQGSKVSVHDHLYFEIGYSRAVMTKNWKYIAVRYPKRITKRVANGEKFNGWKGELLDRPYYVRNANLGFHSKMYHPHYFEADQLFDLQNDLNEGVNLGEVLPNKLLQMKSILSKYLKSFENRPYAEFTKPN